MMEDRKWEELNMDCLVNILGRVGLESLVDDIPLVCKSWYKGTLNPLCWQSLFFSEEDYVLKRCKFEPANIWLLSPPRIRSMEAFANLVIHRSQGGANVVSFSSYFLISEQVIKSIGDGCPSLKRLILPDGEKFKYEMIPSMICKWKNLEVLEISEVHLLEEIISETSVHCKKFVSLSVVGSDISESEASAIATLLPNIEFLSFRESAINSRDVVVQILKGCQKLVHFDAGWWFGFNVDSEIKSLAAHITYFKYKVSIFKDVEDLLIWNEIFH